MDRGPEVGNHGFRWFEGTSKLLSVYSVSNLHKSCAMLQDSFLPKEAMGLRKFVLLLLAVLFCEDQSVAVLPSFKMI